MVLIFNCTVSREISCLVEWQIALGFALCNFIATQPNTREIYPEFHSYPCYYVYIYMWLYVKLYTMFNSSLPGNEKLRGLVVSNVGGVKFQPLSKA